MQTTNLQRTIVITGGNRGIGYAIIERLLESSTPYDIILTARNAKLGKEAYDSLSQKYPSSVSSLTFQQLDITDSASIDNFVKWVKVERDGKIDVLLNNAGVFYEPESLENKLYTITVNFDGTVELTEKLLPYLAVDGKILIMSSESGVLALQKERMRDILQDPTMTRERIIELRNTLVETVKTGTYTDLGWDDEIYGCTKALLNAYTRWVLVKMVKGDQQCYAVDPCWCKTEMGGPKATFSVEKGTETPIFLINLPFKYDERYNGKFFRESILHEF